MEQITLELEQPLLEHAQQVAAARGMTLDGLITEALIQHLALTASLEDVLVRSARLVPADQARLLVLLSSRIEHMPTEPTSRQSPDALGWPPDFFEEIVGSIDDPTFVRQPQGAALAPDPLLGLFADDVAAVDGMLAIVMRDREAQALAGALAEHPDLLQQVRALVADAYEAASPAAE